MPYKVDFDTVSTVGVESSPVATALAGLRAHEARYFKTKYDYVFTVESAAKAENAIAWVRRILREERHLTISSSPLEATAFQIENIRMAYVFYESGLAINVMYTIDDQRKRAVGFKLSEGMEVPAELALRFKFANQKSRLGGRHSRFIFCVQGRLLIVSPSDLGPDSREKRMCSHAVYNRRGPENLKVNQSIQQTVAAGVTNKYPILLKDGDYVEVAFGRRSRVNVFVANYDGSVTRDLEGSSFVGMIVSYPACAVCISTAG